MAKKSQFAEMEERVLDFWDKGKFFERSVEERAEGELFSFYDGPPFATGLPHYGHILASAIKDVVPRYKTMRGYRVERVWGWDCHGLPIENLVEKELGLGEKKDIEKFGIGKFNQVCRDSVFKYEKEWKKTIRRIGRWIDMEGSYKTMDNSYIESVWWVFSSLFDKGLIYKDSRVSLFCPRCSTPLSNFEIATTSDSYRDVKDPAITVKFKLKNQHDTYLLVWTTTPWTLPANVALAVNPDINYLKVKLKSNGETYIFAETKKNEILKDIVYPIDDDCDLELKVEFLGLVRGKRMVGWEYEPLYNFITPDKPAWRVIDPDFVTGEEGTGIVHIAPAFGEDDMRVARENDLPTLMTVNLEGHFLPEIKPWQGEYVKDADESIMADLEARGALFKRETFMHSYPHCWRCRTRLIYMAQPAWYLDVTKIKKKMINNNKTIHWHPEHLRTGRFGKGIETAPDWNFSRTRYWGAPIPVWECADCGAREIIGSIADLKKKADYLPDKIDLHRPDIDEIKIKCACGRIMERIPEVFDCWFESGSMPYGQSHYPFENKDSFDKSFPADFIAEGQDQTRGWFYTLHVLATALFNKPAYKNVVVNGIVLAEDGRKMSKSLKNFPDPNFIFDKHGVDALRYYLLTSPVVEAENLNFKESDVQEVEKKLLMVLWNVYKFFELFTKDAASLPSAKPKHVLDRWIFSRFEQLLHEVSGAMEKYELVRAARPFVDFVTDLSTWYIRRSRARFKAQGKEKDEAVATLAWVLENLARVMAPFTPFIAEELWGKVTRRADDSVHLQSWPEGKKELYDKKLLENMVVAREIASRGLEARAKAGIAVRQVLAGVKIEFGDKKTVELFSKELGFKDLIKDELNIESVDIALGKENEMTLCLDTKITPELRKKGLAREIVRRVNALRKKSGLTITDRIKIFYETDSDSATQVFAEMKDSVLSDTLADELTGGRIEVESEDDFEKDEIKIWLGIKKI
ncbi:isoleucine--tRNA ligase [Patescibacteria group bacterium]|nr:isoleucine--tRNA ligase [Patescibacteria group bacterium]